MTALFWPNPINYPVGFCKRIFPKEDNGLTKKSPVSFYTVRYQAQPAGRTDKEGAGEI